MKFKFLEHTADIKFQAFGKCLDNAFENAALALSHYLSRGKKIKEKVKRTIRLKGSDNESLLYAFLDEIIFLLDSEHFIISKAKVKIKELELEASLYGDDASAYKGLDHAKAATYAEMYVKKTKNGWEAQVVIDV